VESVIRLLPFASAEGVTNMAADEALVRSAADGVASLRFYGWTSATVSLGYFQLHAVRLTDFNLATLPWVRRPSGGATLVHHHELTYALAVPAGAPWHSGESWLLRMHRIITAALANLGLAGKVELVGQSPTKHGGVLCFQQHTLGDVLCAGRKIVGSAQRKHRLALLQHGSVLLAQSEHASALPGIRETAGISLTSEQMCSAIKPAFAVQTGWRLETGAWTEQELQAIEALRREKYATAAWNERR
jgi:lipoyl(octanoyl) transferase